MTIISDEEYKDLYSKGIRFRDMYYDIVRYIRNYTLSKICNPKPEIVWHGHYSESDLNYIRYVKENYNENSTDMLSITNIAAAKRKIDNLRFLLNTNSQVKFTFYISKKRKLACEIIENELGLKNINPDYRRKDHCFMITHENFEQMYTLLKLEGKI